jgi:hypothetical protein
MFLVLSFRHYFIPNFQVFHLFIFPHFHNFFFQLQDMISFALLISHSKVNIFMIFSNFSSRSLKFFYKALILSFIKFSMPLQ